MRSGLDCRLLLVVIGGVWDSGADNVVTLTTAVSRDATSPMPTAVYRRINVDQHMHETNYAPLDLLRLKPGNMRRSHRNDWKWDSWCQMQPKTGNGTEKVLTRYYYNVQLDQCQTFMYSGNGGNENCFETAGDCERYCKGAAYMSVKDTTQSTYCALQPNAGLCLAMFTKFYYDVNEGRCKSFMYGGCGGNQNRFDALEDCMSGCSPDHNAIQDRY